MNPNAVTIQFKKLARRLDLPMHYHSLRHTAAILALAGGAPVKAVQEMLGHASAVLTMQVYAHSLGDAPDRAAAALDRMVAIPVARQV